MGTEFTSQPSAAMSSEPLAQVLGEQRLAGEQIVTPATPIACLALATRVQTDLGLSVPAAFLAFLQRSDGLDFNGLVLYGTGGTTDQRTPDLLAANAHWRANPAMHDWLVLGDNDTDLLAWHQPTGTCGRLDRVGLQQTETFPDVATMLERVLTERL
jgi:hypothetical protein